MNFKTFNLFRFDFGFVMVKVKLKGGDLKKCSPFTTSLSFVSIFLSLSLSPISYSLILSQSLSFSFVVWTCVLVCVCLLSVVLLSIFVFPRKPASGTMTMRVLTSSQCKLIQTSNGSFRTSFRNENNSRERREREKEKKSVSYYLPSTSSSCRLGHSGLLYPVTRLVRSRTGTAWATGTNDLIGCEARRPWNVMLENRMGK